ncbi:MAG: hypothetical protein LIP10_02355 [Clostridiales bacterium]|nr:hypothetical protein [Clostridiales bacterium]
MKKIPVAADTTMTMTMKNTRSAAADTIMTTTTEITTNVAADMTMDTNTTITTSAAVGTITRIMTNAAADMTTTMKNTRNAAVGMTMGTNTITIMNIITTSRGTLMTVNASSAIRMRITATFAGRVSRTAPAACRMRTA